MTGAVGVASELAFRSAPNEELAVVQDEGGPTVTKASLSWGIETLFFLRMKQGEVLDLPFGGSCGRTA
jgi:hypothetical protein